MIHGQMKWVEKDSFLRITVLSPLMVSKMAVRVRQYTAQGKLIRIEQTFDVTSSSTKQSFFLPLVEGWIESISVGDSNFIVLPGRVFVQIAIQADKDKNNLPHTILAADYFISLSGLQWPGTPIRSPREGRGFLTATSIGNPAAGANFSWIQDTATVRRIYGAGFRLVTNATVGSRRAVLEIEISGILAFSLVAVATQAENSTVDYSFSSVGTDRSYVGVQSTFSSAFPPDLYLKPDDIIRSRIDGMQAGDQISNIVGVYEEWVEER
jgi:hypothetical protein